LKPERWGSLLVQEKYHEEKACDKRDNNNNNNNNIIHIEYCTHTMESANAKYETYLPGEITLHLAQIVNTEQL
jgi:hypothetical protein